MKPAVTTPVADTVATEVLELDHEITPLDGVTVATVGLLVDHETALSAASEGLMTAVSVRVAPTAMVTTAVKDFSCVYVTRHIYPSDDISFGIYSAALLMTTAAPRETCSAGHPKAMLGGWRQSRWGTHPG